MDVRHNVDMPLDAPDLLKERAHFSRAESRAAGQEPAACDRALGELAERRPSSATRWPTCASRTRRACPISSRCGWSGCSPSPFAFYRGTAGLMALDLGRDPHSGILVAACGDAHISNFGFYASPERQLVFDLNDFDEAAVAPWEWDVKRLIASVVIGGREAGYDERDVVRIAARAFAQYVAVLRQLVELSPAGRYFMHLGDGPTADVRTRNAPPG